MRLVIALLALSTAALPAQNANLTETYHDAASRLINAALADKEAYARLTYLCDRIGNRLSGSPALDQAVAWSVAQMKAAGLTNVQTIPAKVPHWVRGQESAQILAPVERPLHMLGLGMSVATPPEGITADALVVSNFDELAAAGEKVKGKIVVYNVPYEGYGKTVIYRAIGPSRAAKMGAVAVLVRSITPLAMQIPHTGSLSYDPSVPKIPAAAISIEDAMLLDRIQHSGDTPRIHLAMQAHMEPDVESADVMGEIPGSERPQEVVVMGGHLDSWDVGEGAQDDGSGIMASLEAAVLIKRAGLHPKRTIRVVFWVNEENGSHGAEAYRAWVGDQIHNHVAAIEMDGGAERPTGFGYSTFRYVRGTSMNMTAPQMTRAQQQSLTICEQISALLQQIDATHVRPFGGGEDIAPLTRDGVPSLSPATVGAHYFDWHHTITDTLDKVNPEDFNRDIAVLSVLAYVLADMPGQLSGMPATGTE